MIQASKKNTLILHHVQSTGLEMNLTLFHQLKWKIGLTVLKSWLNRIDGLDYRLTLAAERLEASE